MQDEIFRGRERAFEAEWANRHDAELIEKLRQKDRLEAITEALAKKLQADDPALLQRAMDMGITLDTGPAFLLAPLVQVAWAEGSVTEQEKETVLRLAAISLANSPVVNLAARSPDRLAIRSPLMRIITGV